MKIKCWYMFGHKWTKWADVTWGKEKKVITHNQYAYATIYQTRECVDCKYTQIRSSSTV